MHEECLVWIAIPPSHSACGELCKWRYACPSHSLPSAFDGKGQQARPVKHYQAVYAHPSAHYGVSTVKQLWSKPRDLTSSRDDLKERETHFYFRLLWDTCQHWHLEMLCFLKGHIQVPYRWVKGFTAIYLSWMELFTWHEHASEPHLGLSFPSSFFKSLPSTVPCAGRSKKWKCTAHLQSYLLHYTHTSACACAHTC